MFEMWRIFNDGFIANILQSEPVNKF